MTYPQMCILYLGVDYDHNDTSGNGSCLDYHDPYGVCLPCKDAIAKGYCPKKRKTPVEG
jgi:hypothetical protein